MEPEVMTPELVASIIQVCVCNGFKLKGFFKAWIPYSVREGRQVGRQAGTRSASKRLRLARAVAQTTSFPAPGSIRPLSFLFQRRILHCVL